VAARVAGGLTAFAALAAGALVPILVYPRTFGSKIFPLGPDVFGYVWETRAVGAAPLSAVGTRPGVPVMGAILAGFHAVPADRAPLVLGFTVAAVVGLIVGALVRQAFSLPGWALGVVALVVALWGGVLFMATGYLANELSLACIVLALLLATIPGGSLGGRMAATLAAATAASFAHLGFVPLYAGIAGLWTVLSVPRFLGRRRAGERWWDDGPIWFSLALAVGAGGAAAMVFGVMGLPVADLTRIDDGVLDFTLRLHISVISTGLGLTAVMVAAAVGLVAVWRLRGPRSASLIRLGIAWIVSCGAGGLLTLIHKSFPGHRAVLMLVPLPVLASMGVVGVALAIQRTGVSREPAAAWPAISVLRGLIAATLVIVSVLVIVRPFLARVHRAGSQTPRGSTARMVGTYLATIRADRPVVVFTRPASVLGALSWPGLQNQVRAYAPRSAIADTFLVVGELRGPDGTRPVPTWSHEGAITERFHYAVGKSWEHGGAAVRAGGIVVLPQAYSSADTWNALPPSTVVAPGLAVLRGPHVTPAVAIAPVEIPSGEATRRGLVCLALLVAFGGGFAGWAARTRGGSVVDALAMAPVVGASLLILVGTAVGVPGGNPAGVPARVACVAVAATGYLLVGLTWRRTRAAGPNRPGAARSEPSAEPPPTSGSAEVG
jgi:hypothetical protein